VEAAAAAAAAAAEGLGGSVAALGRSRLVGLGWTCALASAAPKRGQHRAHVATYTTDHGLVGYSLELAKGARTRSGEDRQVSRLLVRALADAAQVQVPLAFPAAGLVEGERVPEGRPRGARRGALAALYSGRCSTVVQVASLGPRGETRPMRIVDVTPFPPGTIVYPGSYNPLHEGHLSLMRTARALAAAGARAEGRPPPAAVFEIAAFNADKPPLARPALEARLQQFTNSTLETSWAVVVTKVPLFIEKARLFPNCTFVVGADTATRLIDPKYYHGDPLEMINALSEIAVLGCRFVVGGRRVEGRGFLTVDHVLREQRLPQKIKNMFYGIVEEAFRMDISSTELRQKQHRRKSKGNSKK